MLFSFSRFQSSVAGAAYSGGGGGSSSGVGKSTGGNDEQVNAEDKGHMYWAKGTGFGTGSTQQSWNVEQALLRQKSEEEHVTVLLQVRTLPRDTLEICTVLFAERFLSSVSLVQVLSSYINPGDKYPSSLGNDEQLNYRDCSESLPELPPIFLDLLQQSCLIPALSYYLRNDSGKQYSLARV